MPRVILVLLIGVAGCRSGARPQEPVGAAYVPADVVALAPDAARDRFIRSGLTPIGETRAEIAARLGRPDSVVVRTLPNRHDPVQIDSVFRLHYAGLDATVYVAGGRDFLASVTVTADRWLRYPVVRIGMRWSEVRRRIGEPRERLDGGLLYVCPTCGAVEEPVIIAVRGGVVRSIEFTYYVD